MSAGVGFLIFPSKCSSSSNLGSTLTVSLSLGCIALLTKGNVINIRPTIIRLNPEKIVRDVGTASVKAPFVAAASPSPPVATLSGIDPDIPACQTKNPE